MPFKHHPTQLEVVVPAMIPYMGQIELFENSSFGEEWLNLNNWQCITAQWFSG